MGDFNTKIQIVMIWAIPVLFAITLHEVAHGWVASKFGDKTALYLGRITLNPIKHIDPIGTILVPLLFVWLGGGIIFGWAKPVPVDYRNLRNPRRDMAIVAAAGPLSNLLMAIFWAIIAKIGFSFATTGFSAAKFFVYMGEAGIAINLMLMLLNFIPIPPLDGSRVVAAILPRSLARVYEQLEPFGFIILILLIFTGMLGTILLEPLVFLDNLICTIFQIRCSLL